MTLTPQQLKTSRELSRGLLIERNECRQRLSDLTAAAEELLDAWGALVESDEDEGHLEFEASMVKLRECITPTK